jgi:general secretion pathway protein D
MNATRPQAHWALVLLGTLALAGFAASALPAQAPKGTPSAPKDAKAPSPAQLAEKKVSFEMRNEPWAKVLEWLSDQTGLPIVSTNWPTGTFTHVAPHVGGKPPEYTIPQVIDIINDGLLYKKYTLIRGTHSLVIVSADEPLPEERIPTIDRKSLPNYGRSEIVRVIYPLHQLLADSFAPEIKKAMGPFGKAVALVQPNQLLLQDTAGNLRNLMPMIDAADKGTGEGQANYLAYKCKYISAHDAESQLRDFLNEPRKTEQTQQQGAAPPGFIFPRGGFPGFPQPQPQPSAGAKAKPFYILSNDATNTVFVSGPPNKVSLAESILKKIDVASPGSEGRPRLIGPPTLRTYSVPDGNAEALAKALNKVYVSTPTLHIEAVSPTKITVYAPPEEQIKIEKEINGSQEPPAAALIPLASLDAKVVSDMLKGAFPGDAKTGAPFIDADLARNAIVVKGSAEQVKYVQDFVKALKDQGGGLQLSNKRVIFTTDVSSEALAEVLKKVLGNFRQNPVEIQRPFDLRGQPKKEMPRSPVELKPPTVRPLPKMPRADCGDSSEEEEEPQAQEPPKKFFTDPQAEHAGKSRKLPGSAKEPIYIKVFPNRIEITSEDKEALDQVQELVNLLIRARPGEHDFQVIQLENANAEDTAKMLDEVFNGKQQQQQPFFFGRRQPPPSPPKEDKIRVVAEPVSNSILVWASPLDMITIRGLVKKIDQGDVAESSGGVHLYPPIKLKYVSASEVVEVLRAAYRDQMGLTAQSAFVGGFPGFGFFAARARGQAALQSQKPPKLQVGVDDHTNTLWVVSTKLLYEDVKKLAESMDKTTKDQPKTIDIIKVKGVDPQLIEDLVDALNGKRPVARGATSGTAPGVTGTPGMPMSPYTGGTRPTGTPSFQPGSGFQPQPPGGFRPGGGLQPPPGGFRPTGGGGPGRFGGGQTRGPDFFEQRVTDDPQPAVKHFFFDPQRDLATTAPQFIASRETMDPVTSTVGRFAPVSDDLPGQIVSTSFQERPAEGDQLPPPQKETFVAPRLTVNAVSLPQLGLLVLSGQNPEDVKLIRQIIEYLRDQAKAAETVIYLQPLERSDATSVTNSLNQLLQRVAIGPDSTQLIVGPTAPRPAITAITPTTVGSAAPPAGSVFLLPLQRQNAILLAVPRSRLKDVVNYIKMLDTGVAPQSRIESIPLKHAPASRVATLIGSFYSQRYGTEQNQIHITADDTTNSVLVTAAPADMDEIRDLIKRIDTGSPGPVTDLRVVRLKYASSDTLAAILTQAIGEGFTPTTATTPIVLGQPRPAGAAITPTVPTIPGLAQQRVTTITPVVKSSTIRFINGMRTVEAGVMEDVRITSDARTNSLVITAPENAMALILEVVASLDVVPAAQAEAKVYFLKKLDAATAASTLQTLYTGAGVTPTAPTAGRPGVPAIPAAPTVPGGVTPGANPLLLVFPGMEPPEPGATIIPVRLTIEPRTNSLIYAGSRNDVDLITSILDRLENSKVEGRHFEVYRLKNAQAPDVANALTTFLAQELAYRQGASPYNVYQQLQEEVTITPDPINNLLLIGGTPEYIDRVLRMAIQMDVLPPQVVIQALVAEVDFSNVEEFGMEFGLQSPVLFQRSVLASGTVANTTTFDAAVPGFNFNNVSLPLGQATLASPSVVGTQGLTNIGVGRADPATGLGGFVFSAASESFNLLIRALATQGRIDVLSRPQVMTADNQQASIQVGQKFPYITGSVSSVALTGVPTVTNTVAYESTGVILQVVPKINPDGSIIMRVVPVIETPTTSTTEITSGVFATAFNIQTVETTVVCQDGETVAIGGLIAKKDDKEENKVPWLGDLPILGALWRYRTENKTKTELLVILTPHIVRCRADADRVLAEESRRMDWVLGDVLKTHGTSGMAPVMPTPPAYPPDAHEGPVPPLAAPVVPGQALPPAAAPAGPEQMPPPRLMPPGPVQGPALSAAPIVTPGVTPANYQTAAPAGR